MRWRFKQTADERRDKATLGRSRMERVADALTIHAAKAIRYRRLLGV
jgi:hypothetical protein